MSLTPLTGSVAHSYHPFGYKLVQKTSQGLCCTLCRRECILLNTALQYTQRRVGNQITQAIFDFHLHISKYSIPSFYSAAQLVH